MSKIGVPTTARTGGVNAFAGCGKGDIGSGFYYVMPGQKKVLEEAAKQYAELYAANNVETGWSIYESVTGNDLPLYVVAHPARSQAEFYEQRETLKALFGEESKKLGEKVMQAVRRVELKDGWIRGDLSFPATDEHADH